MIQNDALINVVVGLSGQLLNRRLNSIATVYARATNGASFVDVGGVKEVYITIFPTAAFTNEKKAMAVFDCETEASASAALSNTGGQTVTVQQFPIQLGVRCGPFNFTDPVNWIDIASDVAGMALIEATR